ncbi:MAG: ABC transporter substrate-binding protein [Candidatus Omnitrophica bacterium]|nr:ABC transporter substrate-binding protein [Candidatus Omnitrophota bacterium]
MYTKKLGLILLFFLLGCGGEKKISEKKVQLPNLSPVYTPEVGSFGGTLTLATISDPKSFNPLVAKETSTTVITGLIFEGLTRVNGVTLEVEPNLAKSWEIEDEGRVYIFELRDDVFWQDGEKFSSDDVVFTFNELIYNPDIPSSARDIFTIEGEKIKVEKISDYKIKFTLPKKFAPFLMSMGQEILPKHILEKPLREGKFNFIWGLDTPPKEIIGTGPFRLAKYLPGEKVILERNPLYWKKDKQGNTLPYLERIVFLIVQSQDTAFLKFKEGEIDYYGLRGEDYPLLKPKEKEGNFTIYNTGPSFGENFLVFNQNRDIHPQTGKPFVEAKKLAWFTNKKFREAVAYALDKDSIINIVFNGLGIPQNGPMSPSSGYFYNPEVKKYEYDIKKAKKILAEEGFIDHDGDGFLEDKEGNRVEFSLYTNSGNTERIKIAQIIRKDLERIGFKVNFLPLEFNLLVSKLDSTYDWEAIVLGLTGGIEPHFGANVWYSWGQLHLWYPRQKIPATAWEKRIDELFTQAVQELDKEKRKKLYAEWQVIVSENLPLIYTVLPLNIFAVRNRFGNLYPTAYGGAFHNIEEIYIINSNVKNQISK